MDQTRPRSITTRLTLIFKRANNITAQMTREINIGNDSFESGDYFHPGCRNVSQLVSQWIFYHVRFFSPMNVTKNSSSREYCHRHEETRQATLALPPNWDTKREKANYTNLQPTMLCTSTEAFPRMLLASHVNIPSCCFPNELIHNSRPFSFRIRRTELPKSPSLRGRALNFHWKNACGLAVA